MFLKKSLIIGLLFMSSLLKAQVVLKADGSDDAYQQISRVLGGDARADLGDLSAFFGQCALRAHAVPP